MDQKVLILSQPGLKMNERKLYTKILLTLQAALLNRITNRMSLIQISWIKKDISIYIYFESEPKEIDYAMVKDIENFILNEIPIFHIKSYIKIASSFSMIKKDDNLISVFAKSPLI